MIKIKKLFSEFYQRHTELIDKYNVDVKTLLQQGISESVFHCDLLFKFKRIVRKTYSLQPVISTRTPDFFLLMLGIQARIIPWTITNNIGVDAKRDFSI